MGIFDFFKKKKRVGEPIPKSGLMPANAEELKAKFFGLGLEKMWKKIAPLARSSVRMTLKSSGEMNIAVGESKFGGSPDLPAGAEWASSNGKPLSFIAQINLGEAAQFDPDGLLPHTGMLYFYYDCDEQRWGFGSDDREYYSLRYFDCEPAVLTRARTPSALLDHGIMPSYKVKFAVESNVPNYFSYYFADRKLLSGFSDREWDIYTENFSEETRCFKLLGHSDNIQGSMEDECRLIENGVAEGYNDPRAAELLKDNGATQWKLLMQIDSFDDRFMWGDDGKLYIWIKESDLAQKDFSNTRLILQCY